MFVLTKHITNVGRCGVCIFEHTLYEIIKSAGVTVRWADIPVYIPMNLKPVGA